MDRITVLVTLLSLYSSCHGEAKADPGYLPPPAPCEDVTINIASTMFVTETEILPPITNTRVLEPDTSFKAMHQHTSTLTTTMRMVRLPHTITKIGHPDSCETTLVPVIVTNTIPVFTTKFLKPLKITKASKMMVWKTVPPITTTVLVTSTTKHDPKLEISVKTEVHDTTIGPDQVTMTMPVIVTDLLAPMTSTVTDRNVHTTTLKAFTTTLVPEVIMKPPETVTSTVIITHTEIIPADTKMVTWTVTQMVNKECEITYNYNTPQIPFPPPTQVNTFPNPERTVDPYVAAPFVVPEVVTSTLLSGLDRGNLNIRNSGFVESNLPGNLFDVLGSLKSSSSEDTS